VSKQITAKELLGSEAYTRLAVYFGESGKKRLVDRWHALERREGFVLKGVYTLGLQGAVLRVRNKNQSGVLKICTLDNIFTGQDAAIAGAPKGTVPKVFKRFPKEESWFLEEVKGASGRKGEFVFDLGIEVLKDFQKGQIKAGLFPLLTYHLNIARAIDCQVVLDKEAELVAIDNQLKKGLVHGDPTPENIITSKNKSTLIDPIGFRGDPAFDWAVLALYSKDPLNSLKQASQFYPAKQIYLWAWLRAELSLGQKALEGHSQEVDQLKPLLTYLQERAWR
jgi:hypothetical protein